MRVVIATDSFKGCMTAEAAARIIRDGLLSLRPGLEIVLKPMADGGEGTARAMLAACGGEWSPVTVTGPLADMRVQAGYAGFPQLGASLVEMASASGLTLLRKDQLDPLRATTYGTGELIRAAAATGPERLWLAVGGSATVDGGVGAALALGWRFLDAAGRAIGLGGGELERIARIERPADLTLPDVEVLCDTEDLLVGERGAAWVVTGEGRFDDQSLRGKVVSGVAKAAVAAGARVAVLAGSVRVGSEESRRAGIDVAMPIRGEGVPLDHAMAHAGELLFAAAQGFARRYLES